VFPPIDPSRGITQPRAGEAFIRNFVFANVSQNEAAYLDPLTFITIYWEANVTSAVKEAYTQMRVLFPIPKPDFRKLIRDPETVNLLAEYAGCVYFTRSQARVSGMDHARRHAIRSQIKMISDRIQHYVQRSQNLPSDFSYWR
jgi:hypothetical protein